MAQRHTTAPFYSEQGTQGTPCLSPNKKLLALLVALALLVSDAAAGLACRLAGGLALAASAVACAVAKISRLNGLNVFHSNTSV